MKRIAILLTGLTALALAAVACGQKDEAYSIVILGDTHYDTEPDSVYHSHYNEPVEWLNRVQRAEFARNGEMWRERCPTLDNARYEDGLPDGRPHPGRLRQRRSAQENAG